jgi:hypothetical protein
MSLADIEKELAMFIEKKEISMRLDSHSKIKGMVLLEESLFSLRH